ncbi:MAG: TIGR00282 family metallophosphoesterase [Verrucomicrobiota bacterium]|nr:TIGR00282 family metallophosphoesterase [Verrucomicrobiota bacterium]
MRLLFIGDIVGEPGRLTVKSLLPGLIKKHSIDFVVANGENSANKGGGMEMPKLKEMLAAGVDCFTSGDHVWDQRDIIPFLDSEKNVLRPHNYPAGVNGKGVTILEKGGRTLGVMNLQGRTFMSQAIENPFVIGRSEAMKMRLETKCIFVDIHAETTSEKIALGRYLDGLVSAVVGTHTHVQTADEQIFPNGTAFLCDVGMTGPHNGSLGREVEPVIKRFVTNMPQRFPVAAGDLKLHGVLIDIEDQSGKATCIERISVPHQEPKSDVADAFAKTFQL